MAREQPWHKSARTSRKKLKKKKKGRHRQRKGQGGRTGRDGAKEDFTVLQYSKWKGVVEFSKVFLNWVGVAWQRKFGILYCTVFFFFFWVGYGAVLCDYCKCECCCVDGVCVCKCRAPWLRTLGCGMWGSVNWLLLVLVQ